MLTRNTGSRTTTTYNRSSHSSIPTRPVSRRNLPSALVALDKSSAASIVEGNSNESRTGLCTSGITLNHSHPPLRWDKRELWLAFDTVRRMKSAAQFISRQYSNTRIKNRRRCGGHFKLHTLIHHYLDEKYQGAIIVDRRQWHTHAELAVFGVTLPTIT